MSSVAALLIAVSSPTAAYWAFGFPSAICAVFGADFVFATGTLFVAKIVEPHEQSCVAAPKQRLISQLMVSSRLAGGLFQTMTQLGTSLGISITTIVFSSVVAKEARRDPPNVAQVVGPGGIISSSRAQLIGYRDAQWTAFSFGVAGAVLALVYLRKVGIVGHRSSKVMNTTKD